MNDHKLLTINQIAKLFGISVRTLHYYDEIGLLTPAQTNNTGYRLFDDNNIIRLHQILFFKELGIKLKDIKEIIDAPSFDHRETLKKQREMLGVKKMKIENLIRLLDDTIAEDCNGYNLTDYNEKVIKWIKEYKEIVKEYGSTTEVKEFEEKQKNKVGSWENLDKTAGEIFNQFSLLMNHPVYNIQVQRLVQDWQIYISNNFFMCSNEMLLTLGDMYVTCKKYADYFDNICVGLNSFIYEAIQYYCSEKV